MNTNYTRIVCGGFLEAKKLLVLELKEGLEKKKISPERIDEIFRKFGYRGPSVRQILEDPVLMTGNFASGEHLIGFILGGSWDEWNEGVEVSGKHIRPLIKKYLDETPGAIERANAEFQATTKNLHISPSLDEQVKNMIDGKSSSAKSPNSVSSLAWAKIHIYSCILRELDSPFAF